MRYNKMIRFLRKPIPLFVFSCIVSIGTLLLYNIPFFNFVASNTNESTGGKIFLLASLVVIMLALNFMMTYLAMFLLRIVGRILLAVFSIINATAVYFIYTYSVMIDATTIENVFNTRYSEASGFFSWSLWLFIIAFGVLPALFCLLQPVVYGKAKKLGIYCGCSLVVILAVASMNISQTLWISQHDTELGGLLQPWSYVANTFRVISSQQDEQAEEIMLPDGQITDDEKAVVVLVIGESARKANFQLYGYERNTNPLLSKQAGLKVYQANACATYTTAGTKAILEYKDTDDLYELLPNYAFRMGVDVSWRTSNWGEPPIHIDEYLTNDDLGEIYPDEKIEYDGILLRGLRERIESSKKNKVLIVLHTSTSHGPKYASKYPKEFEVYKPVARNVEESEKNVGMLVNAYDNTILYTDFLLNSLINTLRSMEEWKSAMIFISDHGESLGENNMFMHGLPMRLAPKVQYEIPFFVWTSDNFRDYKSTSGGESSGMDELPVVLEQHYIFHSVLNLLSIKSPVYNKDYDIFKLKDGTSTNALTGSKDSIEAELLDIGEMPKTAVRQPDAHFQYAVYINEDKPASGEGEMDDVKSVWLANERSGTVIKVCVTNPMAEAQWSRMSGKVADGVDVPITQIAAADKAMIIPVDLSKVIVEGCPDGRNIWTYIIDAYAGTAIQLPSTEGVVGCNWNKKEIIAASYGYDDDGRYSVKKAYSIDGKFLRRVGEKERE